MLQCGVRRVIPLQHYEQFFIKHSPNKAQKRRPRKQLLNMTTWAQIVARLAAQSGEHQEIDQFYRTVIAQQYNLHLMNISRLQGKIKHHVWAPLL